MMVRKSLFRERYQRLHNRCILATPGRDRTGWRCAALEFGTRRRSVGANPLPGRGPAQSSGRRRSGLLVMTLEGEVIARWSRYGYRPGNLVWPHDPAVGDNSEVFVGEVFDAEGVQKFRLGCGAPAPSD